MFTSVAVGLSCSHGLLLNGCATWPKRTGLIISYGSQLRWRFSQCERKRLRIRGCPSAQASVSGLSSLLDSMTDTVCKVSLKQAGLIAVGVYCLWRLQRFIKYAYTSTRVSASVHCTPPSHDCMWLQSRCRPASAQQRIASTECVCRQGYLDHRCQSGTVLS